MTGSKVIKSLIVDFLELLLISVGIVVFSWFFLAEPLEVSGDSMLPTLLNKEQIVAEKVSINFKELGRGEIAVFKSPENTNNLLIKRVIGLPNEKFKISNGKIFINGDQLIEIYLNGAVKTAGKSEIVDNQEITIPEGSYLFLGDNRENSKDSRDFGLVKEKLLVGRAILVYHPFDNFRLIEFSQ